MDVTATRCPVFITGMPRSGTSWLVHSLNAHPDISAFGEAQFFSTRWVAPSRNGFYSEDELQKALAHLRRCDFSSSVPLAEDLGRSSAGWMKRISRDDIPRLIDAAEESLDSPVRPIDLLDAVGRAFSECEGTKRWIEKTASEGAWMRRTIQHVPNARFIVTLRRPDGFMRSYKYQGLQRSPDARARHLRRYHPLLAAVVWRKSYNCAMYMLEKYPDQVSIHVLDGPESNREVLETACRFLEIEEHPDIFSIPPGSNSSFTSTTGSHELDQHDWVWLRLLCDVDDELVSIPGDAQRPGFPTLVASSLKLAPWSLRFVRDVSMRTRNPFSYVYNYLRR